MDLISMISGRGAYLVTVRGARRLQIERVKALVSKRSGLGLSGQWWSPKRKLAALCFRTPKERFWGSLLRGAGEEAALGGVAEVEVEGVFWEEVWEEGGPFDDDEAGAVEVVIPAEVVELGFGFDAVEVKVPGG